MSQRRGDSRLRVWGAERGGAVPNWAGSAGLGKVAPALKLEADLQVTTAEHFTPSLSAHGIISKHVKTPAQAYHYWLHRMFRKWQ